MEKVEKKLFRGWIFSACERDRDFALEGKRILVTFWTVVAKIKIRVL
jgi:hypothetical protein